MINPAVNKNIDTANSRAMEIKNIDSGRAARAVAAKFGFKGGDLQQFFKTDKGASQVLSKVLTKVSAGKDHTVTMAEGGTVVPKSPGAPPEVVEDPGDFSESDPGVWQHIWNNGAEGSGRYQAVIKNNVTGAQQASGGYYATKQEVAAALAPVLKSMNKPHEDYKKKKSEYNKNKTAYDAYVKAKASYDEKFKNYQTKLQGVSAEVTQGQQQMVVDATTDPSKLVQTAEVAKIDADAEGTTVASDAGKVVDPVAMATQTTTTGTTAGDVKDISATTVAADTATDEVKAEVAKTKAAQGTVSAESEVTAATKDPETTAVKDLTAAKGESVVMDNPVQREIQAGEIISGAADAEKAAAFTEQVQAATATPSEKATVKGQLAELMTDFEGGDTPVWAAGAMRAATAAMTARGLGSSSMAGQAIIQAAMESALPIAMADAQTIAGFEMQNLSNKQQRAMLAAQQRATFMGQEFDQAFQARVVNASKISDVANMNFTAEQQVALENSKNANSINMANLGNKQALVLANAAAISQLETQNLSNQQQAAVQNAKAFLDMDLANLNNAQQTSLFKSQSIIQSLLTDQAAENAARQFNASSENQTKQFMSNLKSQTEQFNVSQANAIAMQNSQEANALEKFNASLEEQRVQFETSNGLVIAQANAQWRQNAETLDTAAQNEANMVAAATVNTFTKSTLDNIWQRERDLMDYAFKGSEAEKERMVSILLGEKQIAAYEKARKEARDDAENTAWWELFGRIIF
tara:strand:- start:30 stop:2285 length:2256 start_codon:yes stop_codon:yes gene_type:complete